MRDSSTVGILFLIFLYLFPYLCFGQDKDLNIHFEKDSLEIQDGMTFLNSLIIENLRSDTLYLEIAGEFLPMALLRIPNELQIAPHDVIHLPIKFLASKALIHQQDQHFNFDVVVKNNGSPKKIPVGFKTHISHKKGLSVQLEKSEFYLLPGMEKTHLSILVSNPGLLPVDFKVKVKNLPKGFELLAHAEAHHLGGNEKKEIVIPLKYPNFEGKSIDFYSSLELELDSRERPLRYTLRFLSLGSKVNLIDQYASGGNFSVSNNEINYLGSNFINSLQLNSRSELYFPGHKKFDYSLQYNYYLNQSTYQLFNSYLQFSSKNWGIYAGSLNENLNYNLNGKGIKGTYRWKDQRIHGILMDNDLVIIGNEMGRRPVGYNIALEYLKGPLSKESRRFLAVFNSRPDLNSNGAMMNVEQQVFQSGFHKMQLESGVSLNRLTLDQDQIYELGYAGGIRYGFQGVRFGWQSLHYYSHPNFTGNRRGVLQSEILFDHKPHKIRSYTLGWTFNRNRIKSNGMEYADVLKDLLQISQMNASVGVQQKLSRDWSVGFSPYYMRQQMDRYDAAADIEHNESQSWRLRNSWSYFGRAKGMNISFDQGFSEQHIGQSRTERFYSIRVNSQVNLRAFSLTMFYQYNPYFLSDGLSNMKFGKYHVLTVEPKYSKSFLHNALQVSSSLMYYYHGDSRNSNYVWNGQFEYEVKPGLHLRGDFYFGINKVQRMMMYNPETGIDPEPIVYNKRDPTLLSTRQIRIGLRKDVKFNSQRNEANLLLQFFHDSNGNGKRDDGESAASGVLVGMKGLMAQTDKNGKVKFKVLKGETYSYNLQSHNGWMLSNDAIKQFSLSRNQSFDIPLVKMTLVRGAIFQELKAYQQQVSDFSDYQVLIRGENGGFFQARTNAEGRFIVFLPEGNYKVEVIPKQGFMEVVENGKHFSIQEGKEVSLNFQVINSERRIRIQQF